MARDFTPQDAHNIVNAIYQQMTGKNDMTAFDASSFVSVGEKITQLPMENIFNAISMVLGSTIIDAEAYTGQLTLMEKNAGVYTSLQREISYYSKLSLADGDHNTDLYTNFADGFTAGENKDENGNPQSTKSQWRQNPPIPLELTFGGTDVWQECVTEYDDKLECAFRSENEFLAFARGYIQEHTNDVTQRLEGYRRMALVSKIAQIYAMRSLMPESVVDLTTEYNTFYGTSYTRAQLLTTYLSSFLAFFVARFKEVSDHMTKERSVNYHWSPAKTIDGQSYALLKWTPRDRQRVYMFDQFYRHAESLVLPQIFNPQYLDMNTQFEGVTYWQSIKDRSAIDCYTAVTNPETLLQQKSDRVQLPYVLGAILDDRGLYINFQLMKARTTPVEARKGYRNTWLSIAKNTVINPTQNGVIFIMS